jgi:hypothetical protein
VEASTIRSLAASDVVAASVAAGTATGLVASRLPACFRSRSSGRVRASITIRRPSSNPDPSIIRVP